MHDQHASGGGALGLDDLEGNRVRHRREAIVRGLFRATAIASIVISVAIVVSLFGRALTFITNVDLGSLWSIGWFPRRGLFI